MKKALMLLTAVMMAICLCGCEVEFPNIQDVFKEKKAGQSGKLISLDFKLDSIGSPSKPSDTDIPDGKARVISLSLDESVVAVELGKKGRITYSVKPDTAYDKSVYYESSDENIVEVDKNGYVLGKQPGAVTVNVYTNDGGFKRSCTVIVNHNDGDTEKSTELLELINNARVENGYEATPTDNVRLTSAANQRAYEEAVDMVNYGEPRMDDTRMESSDGSRKEMDMTIFEQYNIWSKSSMSVYVWGEYNAEQAFRAFIEDDINAAALGVRGEANESYDYIAVGYFEFDGITYWSILLTSQ